MAARHERALDAPRMAAAGPLLTTYDPWLNTAVERQFIYMGSDSVVRAGVRALARDGAKAIKVWYIAVPDSQKAVMRARLMVAGEETRKAGLPLIVHATELAGAKDALHAGAKVLVHSVAPEDIDDEFLALAKANGTIVIPTLTVFEGYADVYEGRSPGRALSARLRGPGDTRAPRDGAARFAAREAAGAHPLRRGRQHLPRDRTKRAPHAYCGHPDRDGDGRREPGHRARSERVS